MLAEVITGFVVGTISIMLFTFFAIWEERKESTKRHGKNNL